jgi:hypothetical protein
MHSCDDWGVREDDQGPESFEEAVRSIVREVSRSIERVAGVDLDEVAQGAGVELARARELAESAMTWLRAQGESLAEDGKFRNVEVPGAPVNEDPPPRTGPHPLDLPTTAQGRALAAVDSGRAKVEPGSDALAADGDAPGSAPTPGLVDELRARDWITADCQLTLAGRHALSRWLDAAA